MSRTRVHARTKSASKSGYCPKANLASARDKKDCGRIAEISVKITKSKPMVANTHPFST